MRWLYQEMLISWKLWAIGYDIQYGRGWNHDELCVYIGLLCFIFLKG